jgi:hypothetical protein
MHCVSEDVVVRLVQHDDVTSVIEAICIEMARNSDVNITVTPSFQPVIEPD